MMNCIVFKTLALKGAKLNRLFGFLKFNPIFIEIKI